MSKFQKLELTGVIDAPAEAVFEALCDIEARTKDMPAFQRVEIGERSSSGFVATMYEHYGGRDVVVTSRFRFERPHWLTYEHIESPYGENRGRFTLEAVGDATRVHHIHETTQDIAGGTTLRDEWLQLMAEQLDAIQREALRRVGE